MTKPAVAPKRAELARSQARSSEPRAAADGPSGIVLDVTALGTSAPALQAYIEGVLLLLEARARSGPVSPGPWKQ